MRQVTFSGSAKAFYLDRDAALRRLRAAAAEAVELFPEVVEILLFGSLADGTHTGLSDIDLAVALATSSPEADPLERARPYHSYFQERLPVGVDVLVFTEGERPGLSSLLAKAVVLAARGR
jgi:predicted nucleotidyltransferase